jgi:hypothetical protein
MKEHKKITYEPEGIGECNKIHCADCYFLDQKLRGCLDIDKAYSLKERDYTEKRITSETPRAGSHKASGNDGYRNEMPMIKGR